MINGSIYQKEVSSKNIYTSNIRYLRKMKQTLKERKREIAAQEYYETSMPQLNLRMEPKRSIRKLQTLLVIRHNRSHDPTAENTCVSSTHKAFSMTDHMFGQNTNLNNFKRLIS